MLRYKYKIRLKEKVIFVPKKKVFFKNDVMTFNAIDNPFLKINYPIYNSFSCNLI